HARNIQSYGPPGRISSLTYLPPSILVCIIDHCHFRRGPTSRKSIGLNPSFSAGEVFFNRKSNLLASSNCGSAITEFVSCPRFCQSVKVSAPKVGAFVTAE